MIATLFPTLALMGWDFDGVQKGLDGEPFCYNYTDARQGSKSYGATLSVYAEDHNKAGIEAALTKLEAQFA